MAEADGGRRFIEALLDTGNKVATFPSAEGAVTLSREEVGASILQEGARGVGAAVVMLSRAQAGELATALEGGAARAAFRDPSGDPPPVRVARHAGSVLVSQCFPHDDEEDTVTLDERQSGPLAAAIRGWLREVS